jgi:hypothetical protein
MEYDNSREFLVKYPSGKSFKVKGIFRLEPVGEWIIPMVHHDTETSTALDQRAIVECESKTIYTPRQNLDGMQPAMTEWLNNNVNWGK